MSTYYQTRDSEKKIHVPCTPRVLKLRVDVNVPLISLPRGEAVIIRVVQLSTQLYELDYQFLVDIYIILDGLEGDTRIYIQRC